MKTPQRPISELSKYFKIQNEVWFKFENKHHYGSHKGRSIPYMIDEYRKNGHNSFVISSSGNSAIAALRSIIAHNLSNNKIPLSLHIFVGEHIDQNKLKNIKRESLNNDKIKIEKVKNPKQSALKLSKEIGATLLRTSTDPLAVKSYAGLADELSKISNLSAIFIPSSSGTTAVGLSKALQQLGLNPELHIIQTSSCHPIVSYINNDPGKSSDVFVAEENSLAGAIVDVVARRKDEVKKIVLNSGGKGWIINNAELSEAVRLADELANEQISYNSALSLAGLKKAISDGIHWNGPVVCLLTGP
jgi:threonine dehydratase